MPNKIVIAGVILFLPLISKGQDVSVKASFHGILCYSGINDSGAIVHTYDQFGHLSTFSLVAQTDPGVRFLISQKLEEIPHDADSDPLDQYYVEKPGVWRVGKQYYKFGSGRILRESVLAVSSHQFISAIGVPLVVTAIAGTAGKQQGVIVRFGNRWGASLAIGSHFGISGTSLDYIRQPTEAPGLGRGYDRAYGLHWSTESSGFRYGLEFVGLRQGSTKTDYSDNILDASIRYDSDKFHKFELGVSHDSHQGADYYRLIADYKTVRRIEFVPMIRLRNGQFYDISLTIRVGL